MLPPAIPNLKRWAIAVIEDAADEHGRGVTENVPPRLRGRLAI